MAIEFKQCHQHGFQNFRDGECLECRPIETLNLCSAAPFPGVMARIATHLERYGKITVIYSAISDNPGGCAFLLGEAYAKAEQERECQNK